MSESTRSHQLKSMPSAIGEHLPTPQDLSWRGAIASRIQSDSGN